MQSALWGFVQNLLPPLLSAGIQLRFPDISDPRVAHSMAAIHRLPLSAAWDRDAIARAASLSPSQLDRLWMQQLGFTPWQHWDRRRLRFAQEKLRYTDVQIKEIALELGFQHLTQFSTWFRSRQETSPSAYRAQIAP